MKLFRDKTFITVFIGLFFVIVLSAIQITPIYSNFVTSSISDAYVYLINYFVHVNFTVNRIISDSLIFYYHIGFSILYVGIILGGILIFYRIDQLKKLGQILRHVLTLYLVYIWFVYGWNKVFGLQFPDPGANIMHTQVGDLSKDILFWTSVGSSKLYSTTLGLIEVVVAILIFVPKTRILGLCSSLMTAMFLVLINFSFDVSVKILTMLLVGLSLYLLMGYKEKLKEIFALFIFKENKTYSLNLLLLVGILGLSLLPYLQSSTSNEWNSYRFSDNVHYNMAFVLNGSHLVLKHTDNSVVAFDGPWSIKNDVLFLNDQIFGLKKVEEDFVLNDDSFRWTIDSYVEEYKSTGK